MSTGNGLPGIHVMGVGISLIANLTSEVHEDTRFVGEFSGNVKASGYRRAMGRLLDFPFFRDDRSDSGPQEAGEVSKELAAAVGPNRNGGAARAALIRELEPAGATEHWKRWAAGASAEMTSLAAYYGTERGQKVRLADGDTAVLVASDTASGLRAALFNALLLSGPEQGLDAALDRITYFSGPSERLPDLRGQVIVMRIPQMDAGNRAGFIDAMRGFGVLGRGIGQLAGKGPGGQPGPEPKGQAVFHLSGGYKAAQPYLTGLAEALRGTLGSSLVSARIVHETSTGFDTLPVPLKSLTAAFLVDRLRAAFPDEEHVDESLFEGARLREHTFASPPDDSLDGYAYEPAGDKWRLTPFGAALVELFRDTLFAHLSHYRPET